MWKIAQAAVEGTSHIASGSPCQDECFADNVQISGEDYLIGIIADGAGSALRGGRGASLACEVLLRNIESTLTKKHISRIEHPDVETFVLQTRSALNIEAGSQHLSIRDYACTLLCSIVSSERAIFFQVGDGAIIASKENIFGVVFHPDNGEYVNMTNFITQEDVLEHLSVEISDCSNFSSISMFTDGLQGLAINLASMVPHVPFFEPMLKTLKQYSEDNEVDFNAKLMQFLQSENINSRTDDDKTLILAIKTQ